MIKVEEIYSYSREGYGFQRILIWVGEHGYVIDSRKGLSSRIAVQEHKLCAELLRKLYV